MKAEPRAELGREALSWKLWNSSHSVTSGTTPAARHGLQVGPSQGDATEQETAATEARPTPPPRTGLP